MTLPFVLRASAKACGEGMVQVLPRTDRGEKQASFREQNDMESLLAGQTCNAHMLRSVRWKHTHTSLMRHKIPLWRDLCAST